MKIDIFNHVMPQAYLELVKTHSKEPGMVKRMSSLRMLWDIEHRIEMLRTKFPDVRQVLTLGLPSPELLGDAAKAPEFARVANDGMAEMCRKWPQEFPAFVASLPMNNPKAALEEMDRAIGKLGAKGIQIITSVAGRALDEPEYFPVFERATNHHDVPIWMHPARPASRADYAGEPKSKYEIWQVLGWPFETSVAMARIAFFGVDRIVFASDCPFDPEGGPMFIREGIRSIEELGLPEGDKRKIYFGNAMGLLKLA